ncbi:MAG: DUF2829 domain-containing protein [Candidatus Dormibacteria bacterium]
MDFSEALSYLRRGSRVSRAGWNGKGMWLLLIPADAWMIDDISGERMETTTGHRLPWLASQTDLLADDWQRLVERPV